MNIVQATVPTCAFTNKFSNRGKCIRNGVCIGSHNDNILDVQNAVGIRVLYGDVVLNLFVQIDFDNLNNQQVIKYSTDYSE